MAEAATGIVVMRQYLLSLALSALAAIAAVVAFLAIEAASITVPPGNNGSGYRSDPVLGFDIAGRIVPAHADIVAIGCSQTYGAGVRPDQAFPAVLAGRSGASFVNLAVPSYGGAGSLAMLERYATLRPKVVLYGLWAEHRTRNVTPCVETLTPLCLQRPTIERTTDDYRLVPPGNGANMELTRRWVALAGGSYLDRMQAAAMTLGDAISRPSASKVSPAAVEAFVLRRMAADVREQGARLIVVYIPDYTRGWPPTPPEYAELARREGFTFIDTTDALRTLGDRVGVPGDGHLSADAHAIIATVISASLSP